MNPIRRRFEAEAPAGAPRRRVGVPMLVMSAYLVLAPLVLSTAAAQTQLPTDFQDQLVIGSLNRPIAMALLPDGRLLVAERTGNLRLIVDGKLGAVDPALTVDSLGIASNDDGLLGLAVDPQWPARPYVYTYSTAIDSTIRISRFRGEGNLTDSWSVDTWLDPTSRLEILRDIPNKSKLHNGGALHFGPDGFLYVGLGDDNYRCGSQDSSTFRGVMLRLDVSGLPDGPGLNTDKNLLVPASNPFASNHWLNTRLVWALGLRNPFRFHIDPTDGSIFVGDQGFFQYEEVSRIDAPGLNLGWPYYEGTASAYGPCFGSIPSPLEDPIFEYDRSALADARIVSGGVYRPSACAACSFPAQYKGDYFFSDYVAGFLCRIHLQGGVWDYAAPVPGQPSATAWGLGFQEVSDYVIGRDDALWYCRVANNDAPFTGEIHRIVYSGQITTSVPGGAAAAAVRFEPPYPTPARGRVTLAFVLAHDGRAELNLFDALGRRVRSLTPATALPAGSHAVVWDGRGDDGRALPPGVYLARLRVDGVSYTRRAAIVP